MKVTKLTIATLNAAILALTSTAWSQITYDQSVNTGPGGPGVYYGSGNNNGGFAVVNDTADNIQLGLRGKVYQQNVFPDNGNGIYNFNEGASPVNANRDTWNFDFSINVNANGAGSANLGTYTYRLLVDGDPSATDNFTTINPVTTYGDNEFANMGVAGKTIGGNPANFNVVENSENAAFGLPVGYNPNIPGSYDIELQVLDSNSRVLATDEITIDVGTVPEVSSTLPLLGAVLLGLAFVGRKVKAKAA
jgi:hypothetical protein